MDDLFALVATRNRSLKQGHYHVEYNVNTMCWIQLRIHTTKARDNRGIETIRETVDLDDVEGFLSGHLSGCALKQYAFKETTKRPCDIPENSKLYVNEETRCNFNHKLDYCLGVNVSYEGRLKTRQEGKTTHQKVSFQ